MPPLVDITAFPPEFTKRRAQPKGQFILVLCTNPGKRRAQVVMIGFKTIQPMRLLPMRQFPFGVFGQLCAATGISLVLVRM